VASQTVVCVAVYLDVAGGSFQRRNAATGALEWEIDRDKD